MNVSFQISWIAFAAAALLTMSASSPAAEKNLRELVKQLKATGAKLIWCSTTPVPDGELNPPRKPSDVALYNDIAARVMKDHGVATDDLNAHAAPRIAEIQRPQNVHFTPG